MGFEIKKPYELRKQEREEIDAKAKARKQVINDFVEKTLTGTGINEFLQENKDILLQGGTIKKIIIINLDDLRIKGIALEEVCDHIKSLMASNQYIAEIVNRDALVELLISIDPNFFREEEDEECK